MPTRRRPKTLNREVSDVQFERIMGNAAKVATLVMGIAVFFIILREGQFILAPVFLSIIIGLMFGPVADFLEKRGVPPALSGLVVMVLLLGIIAAFILSFAGPLAEWFARGPAIWDRARDQLILLREPLAALTALNEQVSSIFTQQGAAMPVEVQEGGAVASLAFIAPAMLAQIGIFLASLYFFIATRNSLRLSILGLCISRRLRWRSAHIFSDVETKVSRYLLTITAINVIEGVVVALAMWALGMPTPLLWGMLAALLNYIPYIGQLTMVLILLGVGLGTRTGLEQILLPVGVYWAINLVETQFITPQVMGRTLTLNPFIIFLALTFWIWAWGPVGGLVAVPSLLIFHSIITHVLPSRLTRSRSAARAVAAEAKAEAAAAAEHPAMVKLPV